MLHVLNGDSTAIIFNNAGIPGESLVWREALIAGPASLLHPKGWIERRAEHLSAAYAADRERVTRDLEEQERRLLAASEADEEIVLWFEADLFCQVHLLYILFRLDGGRRSASLPKVTLVSPRSLSPAEAYIGFGRLTPERLRMMFEARETLWLSPLRHGYDAWAAYASQFPVRIEQFLERGSGWLPFVEPALRAHLARFPSTFNGLGRVQHRSIELIDAGARRFRSLFDLVMQQEVVYGLGDFQLWHELLPMVSGPKPLLTVAGVEDPAQAIRDRTFMEADFRLTSIGSSVLAGREDAIRLNGIDLWLGGVHLRSGLPIWRWDQRAGRIVQGERL